MVLSLGKEILEGRWSNKGTQFEVTVTQITLCSDHLTPRGVPWERTGMAVSPRPSPPCKESPGLFVYVFYVCHPPPTNDNDKAHVSPSGMALGSHVGKVGVCAPGLGYRSESTGQPPGT